MHISTEFAPESNLPPFWPHLKFVGLSFCLTASSVPPMLAYDLCQITLIEVRVDEGFYLARYPDVGLSLAAGHHATVGDHYIQVGFFEGRLPFHIAVDADYYLESNSDVRSAIDNGQVESAQAHFDLAGWKEGRSPSPGFSLLSKRPR